MVAVDAVAHEHDGEPFGERSTGRVYHVGDRAGRARRGRAGCRFSSPDRHRLQPGQGHGHAHAVQERPPRKLIPTGFARVRWNATHVILPDGPGWPGRAWW